MGAGAGAAGASCVDSLVAPCAQRDRKRCVAQFKNRCARTVAEEHTGGAVGLVHQAGQRFAAHHEGVPSAQRRHQAAGHGGAVDEARAGGVDIQRGAVFGQIQRPLHLTGHTWGGVRGRKGSRRHSRQYPAAKDHCATSACFAAAMASVAADSSSGTPSGGRGCRCGW